MFVAREHELQVLEKLFTSDSFEMVVLYGRRRVGKTALIDEFVKDKRVLYFTAIQQSAKMNLEDFSRAALSFFGMPDSTPSFGGWSDALSFVAERAAQTDERMVFVFDEFPYAAAAEPALPSMLQIAIDHGFLATKVTMILSGSNEDSWKTTYWGVKPAIRASYSTDSTPAIRLCGCGKISNEHISARTGPILCDFRRYAILSGPYTGSRWL